MTPLPAARSADDRAIALLVVCRLLATLANTSCFTVGVLGTAVYDLGATVFEVSILMLVVNLAIVVGNALCFGFASGRQIPGCREARLVQAWFVLLP